ncbi:alkaline phosphatase [Mesorhizobium sp. M0435]|uniref:alkaline phosphatase n=1 Tax=unclassified Mesorhizobium TaxID=325217 RepID=UPI003337B3DE
MLAQSPFDVKVEFDKVVSADQVTVTINGQPAETVLGKKFEFIEKEEGFDASAVLIRAASISQPGTYKLEAKAGDEMKSVSWQVFGTPATPKAKNVIFFLGDGLSVAHRTGARIMSKGMTEGKANGRLNIDDLDHMAFIGTSATNAISTDSANTMSAYMTGHKTAVNALGVYADRTKASLDDPRVETIAEALRRTGNKSIGVVSTAEVEDATPAAVLAHTRLRADKADIVGMFFDVKPEIVLGGGSAYFLPQSTPGSKRKDDKDYIAMLRDAGYTLATDKTELVAAKGTNTGKILGLFHTGNMDTTLDREFLKKGSVEKFPNQPGLVEMTQTALDQLSKDEDGFFLMVEAASVDKMSHPMDWERSLFETIEFDKAVGIGMEFAKTHPDTLIVATGDHTHGVSIWMTSPGFSKQTSFGLRMACGLVFGGDLRPALRMSSGTGVTRPRSTSFFRMRPTVALETAKPALRNTGPSLSLPQKGKSSLSRSTSGRRVGLQPLARTRCGRRLFGSGALSQR